MLRPLLVGIVYPVLESIFSIATCFSSFMTVHNFHSGPNTWPSLSWIDLRPSSWFNVRVFLFSIRSSFMYVPILGVPVIVLGTGFSRNIFFLISLSLMSHVAISLHTVRTLREPPTICRIIRIWGKRIL